MARQKWHPKPIKSVADLPHAVLAALSSLKMAVLVISGFALALTVATLLESYYDTATAQYYVYRSAWFSGVMVLLGLNILTVALSRYPWQPSQLPFLIAHLGILILLFGSALTSITGTDGMLRLNEGETRSVVELDTASIVVGDREGYKYFGLPWRPPQAAFRAVDLRDRGAAHPIRVEEFLSHADAQVLFSPVTAERDARSAAPALEVEIKGGPMQIRQAFWIWAGDPAWERVQAGPATLSWGKPEKSRRGQPTPKGRGPTIQFWAAPGTGTSGPLKYRAMSSAGKVKEGEVFPSMGWDPGWKGVSLKLLSWIPKAVPETRYEPAQIQYGRQAPPSAVRLLLGAGATATRLWMGLGDRAIFKIDGKDVEVGYLPDRVVLPFSLRLEEFKVETYPGTMDPVSYASRVTLMGADSSGALRREQRVSMNEPLSHAGYTVYQASFEEALPRPTVSIFSVNRDPGRFAKYFGSILLVLGSIWLFVQRTRRPPSRPTA